MKMWSIDWRFLISLAVPVFVAIAGWFFVHRLNSERDLAVRRREARIKSLEKAFLRLASSSNKPMTLELMDEIEMFVSEIQLYGTPRQVELTGQIVEGLKIPRNLVAFDEILVDLRDTIRNELQLEQLAKVIWWFRFNREPPKTVEQGMVNTKENDG